MPADIRLTTNRLELVAGTPELAFAEINDRAEFSRLLGAHVPASWPPPLNDADSMEFFARYLKENPGDIGWACWYFLLRDDHAGNRISIGTGGFKGHPNSDGTVEVGYSILEEFQGLGYATEVVSALIKWAFGHVQVTSVIAETYSELSKSIRVMEKNGLVYVGAGTEESYSIRDFARQV